MPLNVSLADYGVGNLHSIRKALENCGAKVTVLTGMKGLIDADCIVLPGVGAFSRTMERLLHYKEDIVERLDSGVPCLGICIGAQIMFDSSEEGSSPGLGFIAGKVVKLKGKRIPHMGWNTVETEDDIFQGIESRHFYFAHSYFGEPKEDVVIGTTEYYSRFPTLFRKANTYGTQFHPEKSSASGMKFLENFVRFAEGCT
ncbi:MAG: imidazole glycerol phosphate synthase subunit HisH [Methanomassiliicoccales archaeon]|nr:imidazole glycerol phosphate synthase subunit HisH [Methanomassiliicoccales archaeon]